MLVEGLMRISISSVCISFCQAIFDQAMFCSPKNGCCSTLALQFFQDEQSSNSENSGRMMENLVQCDLLLTIRFRTIHGMIKCPPSLPAESKNQAIVSDVPVPAPVPKWQAGQQQQRSTNPDMTWTMKFWLVSFPWRGYNPYINGEKCLINPLKKQQITKVKWLTVQHESHRACSRVRLLQMVDDFSFEIYTKVPNLPPQKKQIHPLSPPLFTFRINSSALTWSAGGNLASKWRPVWIVSQSHIMAFKGASHWTGGRWVSMWSSYKVGHYQL